MVQEWCLLSFQWYANATIVVFRLSHFDLAHWRSRGLAQLLSNSKGRLVNFVYLACACLAFCMLEDLRRGFYIGEGLSFTEKLS